VYKGVRQMTRGSFKNRHKSKSRNLYKLKSALCTQSMKAIIIPHRKEFFYVEGKYVY
jgi:hypothetical protein